MKTVKMIYHNLGSDQHSYPSAEVVARSEFSHEDDKNFYGMNGFAYPKQDTRCFNYDDNGLIVCTVSFLVDVILPDWMDDKFYCSNEFHIIRLDNFTTLSEVVTKKLINISRTQGSDVAQKLIKLMSYTGKSNFSKNIKTQVLSWMDEESNKYSFPLSTGQWQAVTKYDRKW